MNKKIFNIIILLILNLLLVACSNGQNALPISTIDKERSLIPITNNPTQTSSKVELNTNNPPIDQKITLNNYYSKDSNFAYYENEKIEGADVKTFDTPYFGEAVMVSKTAQDSRYAYYRGERMKGVDIKTFEVYDPGDDTITGDITKDKNSFYIYGVRVPNYDPKTYEWLKNYPYAKDKNNVYYQIGNAKGDADFGILEDADAKTFVAFARGYGKDKRHAYFYDRIIDADPKTFEVIESHYSNFGDWGFSKDNKHVYRDAGVILEADPNTFQVIDRYYQKDKKYVFACGRILRGADPATFETRHGDYAKDAKKIYAADFKTYENLNCMNQDK